MIYEPSNVQKHTAAVPAHAGVYIPFQMKRVLRQSIFGRPLELDRFVALFLLHRANRRRSEHIDRKRKVTTEIDRRTSLMLRNSDGGVREKEQRDAYHR